MLTDFWRVIPALHAFGDSCATISEQNRRDNV